MSYCECHECRSQIERLHDQVRSLEHALDQLKRDLEREEETRRSAVREVWNELSMRAESC